MFWMILFKLFFGLISLLLVVRLLGKKSLADITPFDLIYTLVLGGILEESLYDDQVNIGHVILAVSLWGLMIYLIEKSVQRSERITRWIKGEPAVLIMNGKLNLGIIRSNKIEMEQLRAMLRQDGCFSVKNARHVVLEAAGQINVAVKSEEDKSLSFLIIEEGHFKERALESNDLTKKWVEEELERQGYAVVQEIAYGEWSSDWASPHFISYEETMDQHFCVDG